MKLLTEQESVTQSVKVYEQMRFLFFLIHWEFFYAVAHVIFL